MAVRNGSPFLTGAIESIVRQTMSDLELIVVDDGSTDDTAAVLRGFALKDQRIKIHTHGTRGLAACLNEGVNQARAPLVARLDADDLAEPDRLARQVGFLSQHQHVATLGGAIELIDAEARSLGRVRFPTQNSVIRKTLRLKNCIAHSAVVVRTAAVRGVGGYREAFLGAEDYDLWLRLTETHGIANLREVVTRYRLHSAQFTSSSLEDQALSAIAARLCSERRAGSGQEPPLPKDRFTRKWVEDAGIGGAALAELLARHCLAFVETLGRSSLVSNEELDALLRSSAGWIGEGGSRTMNAGAHWLFTKRQARTASLPGAARSLARCVTTDPSFLSGRLLRRMSPQLS
jgi:hypothetical protein